MAAALVSSRTVSSRVIVDGLGGTSLLAPAAASGAQLDPSNEELESQLTINLGPIKAHELLRGPFAPVLREMYRACGAVDYVRQQRIEGQLADIETDLTLPLNNIMAENSRLSFGDN